MRGFLVDGLRSSHECPHANGWGQAARECANARRLCEMLAWSEARWRREETAPAPVGSLAAPIGTVRRRLRFRKRNGFFAEQAVATRRDVHLVARNRKAVALAAAPLAGRIAQPAARNPTVMGWALGTSEEDEDKSKLHPRNKSAHGWLLLCPGVAFADRVGLLLGLRP